MAGDDGSAESEARVLDREHPEDTILQNYWIPTTLAVVDLHRNHLDAAIRELKRASYYEQFGRLLPTYLRGEAYLALGQAAQAATEFQKVLDHPGWTNPWDFAAIAYLQLGRAEAMLGETAAARSSYEKFLALWKDADSDIPIYQQAKAEHAKLH